MKAITNRIRRLQQQLCPDQGQEQRIWVVSIHGQEFALDNNRCVEIPRECGFLPPTRWLVLYFGGIPDSLNAKELERYLRKNGAQICGTNRDHERSAPSVVSPPLGDSSWSNQGQMCSGVLR